MRCASNKHEENTYLYKKKKPSSRYYSQKIIFNKRSPLVCWISRIRIIQPCILQNGKYIVKA